MCRPLEIHEWHALYMAGIRVLFFCTGMREEGGDWRLAHVAPRLEISAGVDTPRKLMLFGARESLAASWI